MSDLPAITPDTPVIVPAISEKVYDKLWLQRLIIEAPKPSQPVTVYVELVPYDGEGNTLPSPLTYNTIPDAFGLAATDTDFAQVLAGIITMANKYKSTNFNPIEVPVEPPVEE
jgi:hypothetical protein